MKNIAYLFLLILILLSLALNAVVIAGLLTARDAAVEAIDQGLQVLSGLEDETFETTISVQETIPVNEAIPFRRMQGTRQATARRSTRHRQDATRLRRLPTGAAAINIQLTDEEAEALRRQLEQLRLEHRDLDDVIHHLSRSAYPDQLQLKRLKKRKLRLKDMMQQIESRLIPDIDA